MAGPREVLESTLRVQAARAAADAIGKLERNADDIGASDGDRFAIEKHKARIEVLKLEVLIEIRDALQEICGRLPK